MIVGSGVLVVLALVLLVTGVLAPALGLVYASICASVVAFGLLLVAVRRRRGELPPDSGTLSPAPPLPTREP